MHNCSKIKEDLLDLVFEELQGAEKRRLSAEIQNCAFCRTELQAIEKTLDLYSQATDLLEPSNIEWQNYQTRLLNNFARPRSQSKLLASLQKFFSSSIKIPVPALAAVLLVVCGAFFLTVRLNQSNEQNSINKFAEFSKQTTQAAPEIRIVEKPVEKTIEKVVIQKQIVTRTIRQSRADGSPKLPQTNVAKTQKSNNSMIKALNLSEFQSVNQSTPIIVKGNSSDEK